MTALSALISDFAALLHPATGNDLRLSMWIARVRESDLPWLHPFATGLERDRAAADAAVTLPFHNGRTREPTTRSK